MIISRVFIPGNFEDAIIYMGKLITLTSNRSLRFYDLEELIRGLSNKYSHLEFALELAFTRNDWLSNTQFDFFIKDKNIKNVIINNLLELSKEKQLIVEDIDNYKVYEEDLNIPGYVILDMLMYSKRLYIAADSGLYHLDTNFSNNEIAITKPVKKHDARCLSTSAMLATVNVSCGDDGLFSLVDDFSKDSLTKRKMEKISEKSYKTIWTQRYDFINYSNTISPTLIINSLEDTELDLNLDFKTKKEKKISRIGVEKKELNYLFKTAGIYGDDITESIQFIHNTKNTLIINTSDGSIITIGIIISNDNEIKIDYNKKYEGVESDILSINQFGRNMIVETNDKILLFSRGKWEKILGSEVLTIRTFNQSKRYKNMAAITTEEGIYILHFADIALPSEQLGLNNG